MKIHLDDKERKKIKRREKIKNDSYTVDRLGNNTYKVFSDSNPDEPHTVYKDLNNKWHCDKCKGFIYRLTCTHIERAKIVNSLEKNFDIS